VDVMNDLLRAMLVLFAAAVVLFIVEMMRP
jgi:hypothetical protein